MNELLDTLNVDEVLDVLIEDKKSAIGKRLDERRTVMQKAPAQQRIVDDYFAQLNVILNDELSVDRFRGMVLRVIKESFSEQDIDALTAFYRTRSGRDIVARMPSAARTYLSQQHAYEENRRTELENHVTNEALPPSFYAGFHPWDNPDYAHFFALTIGQDVKMRWPMAVQRFDDGVQTYTTELMTRLRTVTSEFNDKLKASAAQ